MIISSKIQRGDGGVTGFNEYSLTYDLGVQDEFAEKYGHRVDGQANNVLYHTPDNGSPVPVRVTKQNKWLYLETAVMGNTANDVLASVAKLRRMVEQTLNDSSENVRVALTPTAGYTTYYDILQGYIDDSGAYYQDTKTASGEIAPSVVLILECKPGGYGDRFTLENALASSPGFIEFNTSASLADGWSVIGTPTTSVNNTRHLSGGKSQRIDTDTSTTEGIACDLVTAATSTNVVAYVWVSVDGDPVTVRLSDGAPNTIQEKTINPATPATNADKTAIDSTGGAWYRISLKGTNTSAADFRLYIFRDSSVATQATTIRVDNAYLQTGTLTVPDSWCSSSSLKNRYDPSVSEANINYLDMCDIPGDLPALVKTSIECTDTTASNSRLYASRFNYSKNEPAAHMYMYDDPDNLIGITETVSLPTAWSATSDSTAHGGSYISSGTGTGVWNYYNYIGISLDNTETDDFHSRPSRLFARMRVSGGTVTIIKAPESGVGIVTDNININGSLVVSENTIDNTLWRIVDLGAWNPSKNAFDLSADSSVTSLVKFYLEASASTVNVDIDVVWALPVDEEIIISDEMQYWKDSGSSLDDDLVIDGEKMNLSISNAFQIIESYGSLWKLLPHELNRIIIARDRDSGVLVSNEFNVSLEVTPRTSHLLGY